MHHLGKKRRQVDDLGFTRCVVDRRLAFRAHGRHQQILGCSDARELQHDVGTEQSIAASLYYPARGCELGTEQLEPAQMHIDWTGTEVIAARHRDACGTTAGQQRAKDGDRCSHLRDEFVWSFSDQLLANDQRERRAFTAHNYAHVIEKLGHHRYIGDVGNIVDGVGTWCQKGRSHQLEHRVLRAADRD